MFYHKMFYRVLVLYYKQAEIKNDHPFHRIAGLFAGSFAMLWILIRVVFLVYYYGPVGLGISKLEIFLSVVGGYGIAYLLFLKKKIYLDIYERYRYNEKHNSGWAKTVAIVFLILSYLSPIIFAILYSGSFR